MGVNASGTRNLPSGSSHQPFSFLVVLSASASWSWAGVYCGRVKVNSGIFESTKVLIDPPPAAPSFLAACFAALSASQFPHVCRVSFFGDPNNAPLLLFQVPIQHLTESRFLLCL